MENNNVYGVANNMINWSKPPQGSVVCKFDGALFQEQCKGGFGYVLRDNNIDFLAAKNGLLYCDMDPSLVDSLFRKEALSWLKQNGFQRIVLETDCLTLEQGINYHSMDLLYKDIIVEECVRLLRDFESFSLCFVQRYANVVAHSIFRLSWGSGYPILPR